ncbi:hypothetical protein JOC93_003232 [Priestia taiwanensis]|nr:hypothetical protein [Priestia taiwanensis]
MNWMEILGVVSTSILIAVIYEKYADYLKNN